MEIENEDPMHGVCTQAGNSMHGNSRNEKKKREQVVEKFVRKNEGTALTCAQTAKG